MNIISICRSLILISALTLRQTNASVTSVKASTLLGEENNLSTFQFGSFERRHGTQEAAETQHRKVWSSWKGGDATEDYTNDETQVIFLDFNNEADTFFVNVEGSDEIGLEGTLFQAHRYTLEEQTTILDEATEAFKFFNVKFVTERPVHGDFASIIYNVNDNFPVTPGILIVNSTLTAPPSTVKFSTPPPPDFRNTDRNDVGLVDVNVFELAIQLDPTGGIFEQLTGIPVGDDPKAAVSFAVVRASVWYAKHDTAHMLGAFHRDALGAPGDGLPESGDPSRFEFVPPYDGPSEATETELHIMNTGGLVSLLSEYEFFLSERSALKLCLAEQRGPTYLEYEAKGYHHSLYLAPFIVPNTIVEGKNSGSPYLGTRTTIIEGRIDKRGEQDYYRFEFCSGDIFTAEVISKGEPFGEDRVITHLTLYLEDYYGVWHLISENYQYFEGFDPLLLDIEVPETGTYVIQVDAPNVVFVDNDGDGNRTDPVKITEEFPELEDDRLTGDYSLLLYMVEGGVHELPHYGSKKGKRKGKNSKGGGKSKRSYEGKGKGGKGGHYW